MYCLQVEGERLKGLREGGWAGRSGTMDRGPGNNATYVGANATVTTSLDQALAPGPAQAPQSLRLKKRSNETLPPLERVHSAPGV